MQTAEIFEQAGSPIRAAAIRRGGVEWLLQNQLMVEHWGADCGVDVVDAIAKDLPEDSTTRINDPQDPTDELVLLTSLSPHRIRRQLTCLRTWRYMGLSVIAVQSDSEIETLEYHFPDVDFRSCGQYRPTIVDMLAELSDLPQVLLLNADLEIYADQSEFLSRWSGGEDCRLGFRWNYRDIKHCTAEHWGVDAIRLTSEMYNDAGTDDQIKLGSPGWDWFLPALLEQRGFNVSPVNYAEFFHQVHRQTWTCEQSRKEQVRLATEYRLTIACMQQVVRRNREGGFCSVTV